VTLSATTTAASDLARRALLETVPAVHVGKVMDSVAQPSEDSAVVIGTHTFECTSPGYPGWYWEVSVVGVEGQDELTVSEVNLLPGTAALVPSAWKPWADRIEAGDLGVGDLLPAPENDERLTAGFTGIDEFSDDLEPLHPQQWEMGLGREQILSPLGMERAVDRWFEKLNGPRAAMAKSAPAHCGSCGFLVPIGGSIGQVFGVCGNEFGAADGQIVATTFGCGAHSSVKVVEGPPIPVVDLVIDDRADELSDGTDLPDYEADPIVTESDDEIATEISGIDEIESAFEILEAQNLDDDENAEAVADFFGGDIDDPDSESTQEI
jgi:hypothetical protein